MRSAKSDLDIAAHLFLNFGKEITDFFARIVKFRKKPFGKSEFFYDLFVILARLGIYEGARGCVGVFLDLFTR